MEAAFATYGYAQDQGQDLAEITWITSALLHVFEGTLSRASAPCRFFVAFALVRLRFAFLGAAFRTILSGSSLVPVERFHSS